MPSHDTVRDFIALVERNEFLEAIATYYAESASMQENQSAPRVGVDALLAGERQALARFVPPVIAKCAGYAVNGDRVAINWIFEFGLADGKRHVLDEIAWQIWSGEKIVRERFYYDPATR